MSTHPNFPNRRLVAGALAVAAVAGAATACSSAGTHPGAAASVSAPAHTSASASAASKSSTTAELTSLAQQLVGAGAPGVTVRVDDGQGSPIQIARQAAWTVQDGALTPEDEFRMGSNTKTMVGALILQLVAAHTLSLDDSVQKWLPGMVPNGSAITIRMLLDHTSGLFNDVDDPGVLEAFGGQDNRIWTGQELLAAAVSHPPLFAPGTEYSYTNTGYVALSLILEKATGQSLATLVQDRIAKPLGLTDTYVAPGTAGTADPKLADGYEPDAAMIAPLLPPGTPAGASFAGPARGDYVDTTENNFSTEWGAGDIVSNAADWARFLSALVSGKLFPAAQVKEMETTVSEGSGIQERYGLGLQSLPTPCGTVWGNEGQVPGYNSVDYTNATGTRTVVLLATSTFGLLEPKTAAANTALIDGAVCAMLDKPIPTATSK